MCDDNMIETKRALEWGAQAAREFLPACFLAASFHFLIATLSSRSRRNSLKALMSGSFESLHFRGLSLCLK